MTQRTYEHAPRMPATPTVGIDELVPGDGDVLLEIGSGRGAFTLEYAALHPEARLIALELRRKYATLLAERLAERKLTHARCFCEDARVALARLTPDASIAAVAIHFPDPWWKKRHAKRRVVDVALVTQLARLVRVGGFVFVQTDVEDRLAEQRDAFVASGAFAPRAEITENPFAPARSNRERRAFADGLPIHRVVLERILRSA